MTLDDLIAYGADVETGIERCMGNEEVYLELVGTVQDEVAFGRLGDALQAHDLDAAFATAHALKGVLSNLALRPLYEPVYEITELLRSRTDMDYAPLYDRIVGLWKDLCAL